MAADSVVEVQIRGAAFGQQVINTFHLAWEDPALNLTFDNLSELVALVRGTLTGPMMDCLSVGYDTVEWFGREILGAEGVAPNRSLTYGFQVALPPVAPLSGQATGEALPNQAAATIARYAQAGGRRGRGRLQIGPLSEGDQADSILTAGAIARLQTLADELLDPFVILGPPNEPFLMGILSVQTLMEGSVFLNARSAFSPLGSVAVREIVGSQRTRKIGVGA